MTDMTGDLTCDAFGDRLADYLEGDLPGERREAMDAHAAACDACRALLRELEMVTHDAASLPRLLPSHDLWPAIAGRIDAAVLPMDAPRRALPMATRRRWNRPAIAAAALVLVTAGVTHVLTRASLAPTTIASSAPRVAATTHDSLPTPTTQVASTPSDEADRAARDAGSGRAAHASRSGTGTGSEPSPRRRPRVAEPVAPRATVRLARAEPPHGEPVYDREISQLRNIVRERRAQLDPRTVAVLEQSVAVIDSAIAQSRAALAKDPASGLLATQLNHSLEKKVELLRTAALLPARS